MIRNHEQEGDHSFSAGIESVLYIRCMEHRAEPQLNRAENSDGECAICATQELRETVFLLVSAIEVAMEYELAIPTVIQAAYNKARKVVLYGGNAETPEGR